MPLWEHLDFRTEKIIYEAEKSIEIRLAVLLCEEAFSTPDDELSGSLQTEILFLEEFHHV